MQRIVITLLVAVCVLPVLARADDPVAQEMKKDVVLRAVVDELTRNQEGLKLEDLARPYFIEFGITDAVGDSVSAELGAVTNRTHYRGRSLRTDVRVGSYQLDNSNFGGGGRGFYYGGGSEGAAMPIEDDYDGIRQAIWWTADRDYKNVSEELVQKRAFMESKLIKDKPDDFSREDSVVHFDDRLPMTDPHAGFEDLAVALSGVFREYPDIQDSDASVRAYGGNEYLVNTEGTRVRTASDRLGVTVNATVQADDGMKLSDSFSVYARTPKELPSRDELVQRCRKMAVQLIAVRKAPTLGSYTGPVLFDAPAAATIFARQFGSAFAGGQRPVGSRTNPDDFANKLNKRILPKFMSVVDDPSHDVFEGIPVMGHYVYDDQAVPAQAITLVAGGRLKALLMSRNPSKEFKHSNGHGRGSYGGARASVGCLVVSDESGLTIEALRKKLLEACSDEDLEFGIRVASLGSSGGGGYGRGYDFGGGGTSPLVMYKVFPDGHEELVRGAEIARVDLKAFKRMLAAGKTPYVLNTGGADGQTYIVPALLFEELDLAKIDRDFDKPPILPNPVVRDEKN